MQGLQCRVQVLEFRVQGLELRVYGLLFIKGFRVEGLVSLGSTV